MIDEWGGFQVGANILHIGPLSARKSIALYVVTPEGLEVLAYFKTEQEAMKALNLIDAIARAYYDGSMRAHGI